MLLKRKEAYIHLSVNPALAKSELISVKRKTEILCKNLSNDIKIKRKHNLKIDKNNSYSAVFSRPFSYTGESICLILTKSYSYMVAHEEYF